MIIQALSPAAVPAAVAGVRPREAQSTEVARVVAEILSEVRSRGDAALVDLTARLDWPGATAAGLRVPESELRAAFQRVPDQLRAALEKARQNTTWFHRHELPADWEEAGADGQRLGIRHLPVRRAGLYVPGGLGSYASSVIMNVVPAQVAGVEELAICTPPGRDGSVNESVLAAAWLLGVHEVYGLGGAQAVAGMAYGTASLPRVDVITGPGNAYVNEAKRQVFGLVGIDSLAGPSEVLVVADEQAHPRWVAADLLAQEEHGSGAQAILLGANEELCRAAQDLLEGMRAAEAGRAEPGRAAESGRKAQLFAFYPEKGADFLALAASFVNTYAPEHLELHLADARAFLASVKSAGAIFLGSHTPTAFGDYVAGSNHVLPTGGSARFGSALSVHTFLRRQSLLELSAASAAALAGPLGWLADSEGFRFHKLSAELRAQTEPRGSGLRETEPRE